MLTRDKIFHKRDRNPFGELQIRTYLHTVVSRTITDLALMSAKPGIEYEVEEQSAAEIWKELYGDLYHEVSKLYDIMAAAIPPGEQKEELWNQARLVFQMLEFPQRRSPKTATETAYINQLTMDNMDKVANPAFNEFLKHLSANLKDKNGPKHS